MSKRRKIMMHLLWQSKHYRKDQRGGGLNSLNLYVMFLMKNIEKKFIMIVQSATVRYIGKLRSALTA